MSYKDCTHDSELLQRRIDAMELGLMIARGTPRASAAAILQQRKDAQDAYAGDPGVNPEPGVWIDPEGESLNADTPKTKQEAIQANAIARSILLEDFSSKVQWNVSFFPDKNDVSQVSTEDDFDW